MPGFLRNQAFALTGELPSLAGGTQQIFQPLDAPETDLGRGVPRPGAGNLQLSHAWISRCHATIRRGEDNQFYLHVQGRAGCDICRHGNCQHLKCTDAPWLLSPQDDVFICGGPAGDRVQLRFVEQFTNDDAATWWCEELNSSLSCVIESPPNPSGMYSIAAQLPYRVWHEDLERVETSVCEDNVDIATQFEATQFEPSFDMPSSLNVRHRCALVGQMTLDKNVRLFVALDGAWTDIGRNVPPGPHVLQLSHSWVSRQHARIHRAEGESCDEYSIVVESKLGVEVLRSGQTNHLPKACPPWQLAPGDVIILRAPPGAPATMPSVELRFVELFSRADSVVYRRGECKDKLSLPCVVDSGPWPDGTYDVRLRTEAWHGHLKAREVATAEEPMTQMQDLEFAETQAMDELGVHPLQTSIPLMPPPLQLPKKVSSAASVNEGVAGSFDLLASDCDKRQREEAESDGACAKRARHVNGPMPVSDGNGVAVEGVSLRQDVQTCDGPGPDASTPQRCGAFVAFGASPSSTEKTVAPAVPSSHSGLEEGCVSSRVLKAAVTTAISQENSEPQSRSGPSHTACQQSPGSSGRDTKPSPADFFVEPFVEPSCRSFTQPVAIVGQPVVVLPAQAQIYSPQKSQEIVQPPPAESAMQTHEEHVIQPMGLSDIVQDTESESVADHTSVVCGLGTGPVTPWNCEVRKSGCYHAEGEADVSEVLESQEGEKESLRPGDEVECPCSSMETGEEIVIDLPEASAENRNCDAISEQEAGAIFVSGSDSGWGSQVESQAAQGKTDASACSVAEEKGFTADDDTTSDLDPRWKRMTKVWRWNDGILESQAAWPLSDEE